MNRRGFTKQSIGFLKFTAACFLILTAGAGNLFAQYKGSPVKKERLLQALRSRQFQTRDIVTIINTNGVDLRLTPETRKSLAAAGARPEVIQAVSANLRIPQSGDSLVAKAGKNNKTRRIKPNPPEAPPDYDELLDQAIFSYKEQRNPQSAVRILQTAARVKPQNPAAYQMMGFVYLYGLNDYAQGEKFMRESFMNGGSAVFRVYHDDNGKFSKRCTGSLYISQDTLRFESDDNVHTFETSAVNIDKIKLDTESTKGWKKHSIFKVVLKFGKEEAKFRFAPLTGDLAVSRMVERFVSATQTNKSAAGSALAPSYLIN